MLEDADILRSAVELLIAHRDDEARAALLHLTREDPRPAPMIEDRVATERAPRVKRINLNASKRATILNRDGWRCHYCGKKLLVAGIIEIIGALCPQEFPFSSHAMPVARTHPAALRVYPEIDHIEAGSVYGEWLNEDNLVAACLPCNERKSDRLGWTRTTLEPLEWDGLTRFYRPLAERLPELGDTHKRWLAALSRGR